MKSFVLAGESELPEDEDDEKLRRMLFPAGMGFLYLAITHDIHRNLPTSKSDYSVMK